MRQRRSQKARWSDYSNQTATVVTVPEEEKCLLLRQIESIVEVALHAKVAGIIATNTTITRKNLVTQDIAAIGGGGLSGRPLTKRANEVVASLYRYSKGQITIIGVGGIFTAEDAFNRIAAGASLIQAYTGFVYGGPSFPREILNGLSRILKDRGFKYIDEAVGSGQ